MKYIPKIALHFMLICIVVILPVSIYDYMSKHGYHDFTFIGGITYFIYVVYWILKIKNYTAKIICWTILQFLSIMIVGFVFCEIRNFELVLPILLLLNLIMHSYLLIKNPKSKNKKTWKTFLFSLIIVFLLSLFGLLFWLYAFLAMSGMPAMRY